MRILAYNPGHDGAAVLLEDGRLSYSLESEKDNGPRYGALSPTLFVRSLEISASPDVVAISGYFNSRRLLNLEHARQERLEAGYFDVDENGITDSDTELFGRRIRRFSSSHVRSHIMCSYGLSPFPQGQPCYALIWEGFLGTMYRIDEHIRIRKIGDVLTMPGVRYGFLYALADPTMPLSSTVPYRHDDAGKLMALAAYGNPRPATTEETEVVEKIFAMENLFFESSPKRAFIGNKYCDIGLESSDFKDLAWQHSSALFDRFYKFAEANVTRGEPLLIAGGCGLNCDWNTQWRQCGLFSDVFVPPCANDSGIALGTAIDAYRHYSGEAKIEWDVYAGDPFVEDITSVEDFRPSPLNLADVCRRLRAGDVVAWAQGRYEIGPRALGNRSILASPFSAEIRDKLNRIKQRESFRPIAPICLEDDFLEHFDSDGLSPHMLYFQRVKSNKLAAITHVDGSARAQSVNDHQNPAICALLREFKAQTGVGMLCNTSLNFKGHGFINRLSDLFSFARERGVEGIVVGNTFWQRKTLFDNVIAPGITSDSRLGGLRV